MLDNLPNIKHHTTNLLVALSVNAIAQYLFGANCKERFPEETRVVSDGINDGILCNAAINFADSFIYETSPPIYKAATYAIGMCLSLELSNTMNEYTEIKLKQEESEKLSEMINMALDILSSLFYIFRMS